MVEVSGLDDGEHRPEDLFARDAGLGGEIDDDGRLDKVTVPFGATATEQQSAFCFTDLDVVEDRLVLALIDDRTHVGVSVEGRTDCHGLPRQLHHLINDLVVDFGVHDGTRAGRALLPRKTEGRGDDSLDSGINVRLRIDDDGVFTAHLGGDPLEPHLSRMDLGPALEDADADLLGAGKSDKARLGVVDQKIADLAAATRQKVHHSGGHTGLFHDLEHLVADDRRVARRLQDDRVSGHHRSHGHVGQNGAGEVPRGNDHADTERLVKEHVGFVAEVAELSRARETKHLAAVPLEHIDRFADLSLGLVPSLVELKSHPGRELELALPDDPGHLEKDAGPSHSGDLAPLLIGRPGRSDGVLGISAPSLGHLADHLIQVARVDGTDPLARLTALTADDDGVTLAELSLDIFKRRSHRRGIFRQTEVQGRFVDKGSSHALCLRFRCGRSASCRSWGAVSTKSSSEAGSTPSNAPRYFGGTFKKDRRLRRHYGAGRGAGATPRSDDHSTRSRGQGPPSRPRRCRLKCLLEDRLLCGHSRLL